jgi:exosortase/archaeosortase family protein
MLTAFVMVGAALAFIIRRARWQKVILVLSTIPIAILANTLRLVVTAILYETSGSAVAERFFHDFAGFTMMPVAIVILMAELWLIRWIIKETSQSSVIPAVTCGKSGQSRN